MSVDYTEDSIVHLSPTEHIRKRPGMYIGKLGDGASHDDGIYVLIKEIIDNSVDEYIMGFGKKIEITIKDQKVCVRDYGRGIPLGKLKDCVSEMNTGAKYDSEVFKKTVGLNGVGSKAVNALSSYFHAQSVREGKTKYTEFGAGELLKESKEEKTDQRNGTIITFIPDETIFGNYHFITEYIDNLLWNYCFLNTGLSIYFNGQRYFAENGLLDLLTKYINGTEMVYPIIHIKDNDFEFAMTHSHSQYGEEYYSFVNGTYTPQGGTHQGCFPRSCG